MTDDYEVGTFLRHYAGGLWEVTARGLPDAAFQGYYRIECAGGFSGITKPGDVLRVHRDYLHGHGWRVEDRDFTATGTPGAGRAPNKEDGS